MFPKLGLGGRECGLALCNDPCLREVQDVAGDARGNVWMPSDEEGTLHQVEATEQDALPTPRPENKTTPGIGWIALRCGRLSLSTFASLSVPLHVSMLSRALSLPLLRSP